MHRVITKVFNVLVTELKAEDGEPAGYLAESEELGLAVEADNLQDLATRVCEVAPDLFELNVLPHIKDDHDKVRPRFMMHHELSHCGGDVLPGTEAVA